MCDMCIIHFITNFFFMCICFSACLSMGSFFLFFLGIPPFLLCDKFASILMCDRLKHAQKLILLTKPFSLCSMYHSDFHHLLLIRFQFANWHKCNQFDSTNALFHQKSLAGSAFLSVTHHYENIIYCRMSFAKVWKISWPKSSPATSYFVYSSNNSPLALSQIILNHVSQDRWATWDCARQSKHEVPNVHLKCSCQT